MTDTPSADDAEIERWVAFDSSAFDRFARISTGWYWRVVWRLRAHGVEHVPARGGVIIAPNHSSYADPFVQICPVPRVVRFMAKSSLFEVVGLRRIMRSGGAFPVRRGESDARAIEIARRILARGDALVVYAEGTRYRDSLDLGPSRSGAARLALEAGVPIVPVASWGAKRRELYGLGRWQRRRVTSVYGEPMDFTHLEPTKENVAHVREALWARIHELYEQAREIDAAR